MLRSIFRWAGIGGLTTVAVLVRAGLEMTIPEGPANSGGCASTYCHLDTHTDLHHIGYSHNQRDTNSDSHGRSARGSNVAA